MLIVLSLFGVVPAAYGVVIFAATLINNIIHYFNRKARIEKYYQVFMHIIRTLNNSKELTKLDIPELSVYFKRIDEIVDSFRGFQRGSFLVFFGPQSRVGAVANVLGLW